MRKLFHSLLLAALLAALLAPFSLGRSATAYAMPGEVDTAVFQVTTSATDAPDAVPGNGICETAPGNGACTLRAAIMEANALPGGDTIQLPAGTYTLTRVGLGEDAALDGDLDITGNLTIVGAGSTTTVVDGNRNLTGGRVFDVHTGVTVHMSGLCIQNGMSRDDIAEQQGGAIFNLGTLTLSSVCVRNNIALATTAGIYNDGTLTITGSSFTNNDSEFDAGAIYNSVIASTTIINSSFDNNHAFSFGGAIRSHGALTIQGSHFFNNTAREGGAVYTGQDGTASITDSTFNANTASQNGGALSIENASLTLTNATLSANSAGHHGGGLLVFGAAASADLRSVTIANNIAEADYDGAGTGGGIYISLGLARMANSIIANNVVRRPINDLLNDCDGPLVFQGYNLVRITPGCTITGDLTGSLYNVNPLLGALADNGGPTLTLALQPGSPAIDAGDPAGCSDTVGAVLPFDQRGFFRQANGGAALRCDMGAFEYLSTSPVPGSNAGATFQVTTTADAPDAVPGNGVCAVAGSGACTLRAAIMETNALPGADTIQLPAGTYTLTREGLGEEAALDGDLDITGDLTINGAAANTTIIDGNRNVTEGRVIDIHTGVTVSMSNLCIEDGKSRDDIAEQEGGGINNLGTLTLISVCVRDNIALATTAGIYNNGSLTVINSSFTNNDSEYDAGAILNTVFGSLTVINTTFNNNHAFSYGGAINSRGALTIQRSNFSNNSARHGGAINIGADGVTAIEASTFTGNTAVENGGALVVEAAALTLTNSTLTGNFAGHHGGGLLVFGTTASADLLNVTIANNAADNDYDEAGDGGGIYISLGIARMANSIIANNVVRRPVTDALDDCNGPLVSLGYNLMRVTSDCTFSGDTTGNKMGMNPLLGALADNGGPTFTLPLQAGSPAIDAGNIAGCNDSLGAALPFDQRGFFRHSGAHCDMGAFEYQSSLPFNTYIPLAYK